MTELVIAALIAAGVAFVVAKSRGGKRPAPPPASSTPPPALPSSPTLPPGGVPLPGGGGAPPIVLPTAATPCLLRANPSLADQFRLLLGGLPASPEMVDAAAVLVAQTGCLEEAAALRAEANRRRVPATPGLQWVP